MQDVDITIKPRDVMPAGATTLPADFYTDQGRFRVEMDRLFTQDWICAGRVEQVESPGQFFLRELAGESIIITRSASGSAPRQRDASPAASNARITPGRTHSTDGSSGHPTWTRSRTFAKRTTPSIVSKRMNGTATSS